MRFISTRSIKAFAIGTSLSLASIFHGSPAWAGSWTVDVTVAQGGTTQTQAYSNALAQAKTDLANQCAQHGPNGGTLSNFHDVSVEYSPSAAGFSILLDEAALCSW